MLLSLPAVRSAYPTPPWQRRARRGGPLAVLSPTVFCWQRGSRPGNKARDVAERCCRSGIFRRMPLAACGRRERPPRTSPRGRPRRCGSRPLWTRPPRMTAGGVNQGRGRADGRVAPVAACRGRGLHGGHPPRTRPRGLCRCSDSLPWTRPPRGAPAGEEPARTAAGDVAADMPPLGGGGAHHGRSRRTAAGDVAAHEPRRGGRLSFRLAACTHAVSLLFCDSGTHTHTKSLLWATWQYS